ncbi:MAG TPA: penicillin acylase family protein [Bryobacteraceae bacterium]|nr:penicillin acylase family protein [Bryobacteraceae bacterium]
MILVVLGAIYWFGWRTLPQTSGTITAPVSGKAAIARDARGVPHISAASWQDAVFLQGYVTAQDRMWQMDALRRLASGKLAEILGKSALPSDQEARRWRIERIAEQQEQNLTPEARQALAAYARGVNYYLETNRGRLAPEFTILHYDPRPWTIRDSLIVALHMYRTLTSSWREEMDKYEMLQGGDPAKVAYLFPRRTGGEVQPGSNSWVISGAHSADGKPILANDPHLEWSNPSPWYLVHLRAPDLDVTGASLVGIPAVIIGHNRRIAWGVTNLEFDVQDLYRERIDLRTGRYLYRGKMEQARLERDMIGVKGQKPAQADAWITRDGPVFLTEGKQQFAMRWLPAEQKSFDFPLISLDRARNWQEFNAALARFPGPAQNFVYADVDGNIGYHAAGPVPARKNCEPDIPMDGASGTCEWDGLIPYDQLPHAFNPPSGVIVTANQNPFPAKYPWPVDGRFAPKYRAQEIRSFLESRAKWRPEDMLAIEKDVYSAFSDFLARQVVAAWDKHPGSDAEEKTAVDLLRRWNGQMEKGTAAPMIIELTYDQLRDAVASRASPMHGELYASDIMAPEVIENLLRTRPAGWFPDYDALLRKSLSGGLAEGRKLQGSSVARWDYGQYGQLTLQSPVVGRLPLIGSYFNVGPVPMSGSGTTIKQTTRRLGPSMRMIVDFADFDRSLQNVTLGESGHVLSRHYKDQWSAYYGATSFPMEFDKVDAKQTLVVNPE